VARHTDKSSSGGGATSEKLQKHCLKVPPALPTYYDGLQR